MGAPSEGAGGPRIVKLIFQAYLPFQGRYPRVSDQAGILAAAGFDVTVLACDRAGDAPAREVSAGVKVERIRVPTSEERGLRQLGPLLTFSRRALARLGELRPDIIVCHNLDVLPLGARAARRTGARLVFDAHEPSYYSLWPKRLAPLVGLLEKIDTSLARRCHAVTVTNAYQVEKYRRAGAARVELIGNYARPELRPPRLDEERFRSGEVRFGRFGTFYRDVGLEQTLEAWRLLATSGRATKLLLAGRVVESSREAFRRELERTPRVEQFGAYRAETVAELYRQVQVSVLTYPRSDWFRHITPTKFFDSLASGVPVIVTDIGGLGEVVRRHGCGIVVEEGDAEGTCRAMARMIEDREFLLAAARAAWDLSEGIFSWEKMRERYLALFRDL